MSNMFEIINVWPIIKNHFSTLKEDTKVSFIIAIFVIFPIIISSIAVYFNILVEDYSLNALIASFSIFVGFTINVLVLLLKNEDYKDDIKNKLIKHLSYNTLYELLLGLLILAIVLLVSLIDAYLSIELRIILSLILYILIINFFLTILLIAKRIFVISQIKIKNHEGE